jgi:hypothetical protein
LHFSSYFCLWWCQKRKSLSFKTLLFRHTSAEPFSKYPLSIFVLKRIEIL